MHRRLIIALGLLVGLPLVGLTALALKVARDERDMAAVQWRELLEGRLQDLANGIAAQTDAIEREALKGIDGAEQSAAGLRALVRRSPLVSQAFLLRTDGRLAFPPADGTTSADERAFLSRTLPIWKGQAILYAPPKAELPKASLEKKRRARLATKSISQATVQQAQTVGPNLNERKPRAGAGDSLLDLARNHDSGWITWYWQEGLHLLLWRRLGETAVGGRAGPPAVIGVEIDRVAALGRIIGSLSEPANLDGRIVLLNGRGEAMAQWGPLEPDPGAVAAARVSLEPPWDAWRLTYHPSPAMQAGFFSGSVRWSLGLGLGALMLSLLGLAVYLYRESDREMRDAVQRVTFVTQVSHELRTPLTNIRLYAELLDRDLEEEAEGPRQRVATIVSEAQRLSRLISNILTFSRHRRGNLAVSARPVALDRLVEGMVDQFRPALSSGNIEIEVTFDAPGLTLADPDTVDQIVANLLSNVEKYAGAGGWVGLSTRQDAQHSILTIQDRGPGIGREHRDRVFQPFYRISDRLSDGVTGTGLGLALSAELARKNGGALRLVPTEQGACFELILRRAPTEGS